mmetsp:Transcript_80684/g.160286  ORF Transcript_80684/g.160286 Transcript_80684/m.160286 type:complete len:225 (+) Transcript_80684:1805-2479(+)
MPLAPRPILRLEGTLLSSKRFDVKNVRDAADRTGVEIRFGCSTCAWDAHEVIAPQSQTRISRRWGEANAALFHSVVLTDLGQIRLFGVRGWVNLKFCHRLVAPNWRERSRSRLSAARAQGSLGRRCSSGRAAVGQPILVLLLFFLVIVARLGKLSLVVLAARVESKGAAASTPIDHVLRVYGHALIVLLQVLICLLLTGNAQNPPPLSVFARQTVRRAGPAGSN